jgi:hypothetical protein
VRVYEWSGLYAPIVHARHVRELVQEPGPYILGITAECRTLFTAPNDALVVDLDRNFVLTSSPPTALTTGQRTKMINRLTQSLPGDVTPSGVPSHLRSAYGGGKLIPAGQIIVMRGEVESVQDPDWWSQDAVMSVMDHVCEKMGRNSGMKAIFGGAVKKPLMAKVSMRHLNEIVRERNQYSRDALEAWQDFINLKARMDNELTKVTKRNNFLVEELDSWKQQFLKFQAFVEQLTKETQELKSKIETHKRENRRLTSLIDQQKDDAARLTVRLSGTEKQRDDALEALVLQQEIAEELERERKRNKKDLAALQHTNLTLLRQRDEAQRVVVHLRSLIDGQTHHMEHIVRTLHQAPELSDYIEEEFADAETGRSSPHRRSPDHHAGITELMRHDLKRIQSRSSSRAFSRASTIDEGREGEDVNPEMERRFFSSPIGGSRRFSQLSVADVADRHLRDKTDAIADIIRNISDQCAAAVEGLHLAQDAASVEPADGSEDETAGANAPRADSKMTGSLSDAGSEAEADHDVRGAATHGRDAKQDSRLLNPNSRNGHNPSPVPPTPDLTHRSSTAMSNNSLATTPERHSQQLSYGADVKTKIVEHDEEHEVAAEDDATVGSVPPVRGMITTPAKGKASDTASLMRRAAGARISALGQQA